MSLINNMLKDLEQRDSYNHDIPNILIQKDSHRDWLANFSGQKTLLTLSIAIPCLLGLYFLLPAFTKSQTRLAPPIVNTTIQNTPEANVSADDLNWLKPTLISGMSLQVKDNITEITFMLNHGALYRLASDGIGTQLTLTIEKSQLNSSLPTLNFLNSAVEHISSQSVDGNTIFNIVLFPGAVIKYINLSDNVKNPELVVAIQYQSNSPHPTTATENIKTPAMRSLLNQQYQAALNSAEGGEFQTAITSLSSIIKIDPSYSDARVSLAALLLDQGQTAKAGRIIDDGMKLNPDYPSFIELKARVLTAEGKIIPALNLLQNSSPPIADNPDYHAFIAALYQRSNKDILAINLYKQLIAINPHNGNWWFGMGVSLEKAHQPKQASDAYSKALLEGHLNTESLVFLRNRLQLLEGSKNEKG